MSSLDSILDQTLDDLADMPSIQLFPNGAHKVNIEFKIDSEKDSVQMAMTYVEPMELADPTSHAPAPGDKNSVFFYLKKKDGKPNEYAQGALKNILMALKEHFPGSNSKEIMESAKNAEVVIVTKIRVGKGEYEGRDNIDIVKLSVI